MHRVLCDESSVVLLFLHFPTCSVRFLLVYSPSCIPLWNLVAQVRALCEARSQTVFGLFCSFICHNEIFSRVVVAEKRLLSLFKQFSLLAKQFF